MILSVLVIKTLVGHAARLYRTFVIEARFGFNRMTPALYIADLRSST